MLKINQDLLPVKMHYFFFLGAMGPILPFYPLVGKQLGLSEAALGTITAIFPLLYLLLKPFIGFLADYFRRRRKLLFLGFIVATCLSFNLLATIHDSVDTVSCWEFNATSCCQEIQEISEHCQLKCGQSSTFHIIKLIDGSLCLKSNASLSALASASSVGCSDANLSESIAAPLCPSDQACILDCPSSQFSLSSNFWIFTILTSLGSICSNITNFFSDAVCFDVLGEGNEKLYGYQRVWGTIGFGITALLGGYAINIASKDLPYQNFIPAFILATACTTFDLYFSNKLQLPELSKSESIVQDVWSVIKRPRVTFFLVFATFVGILDSSILYFLLWYMEDLSFEVGSSSDIKLLQGLIIAAETLMGETVSFFLSGWVLKKIGYAHSLSLGFIFYSLRLGLLAYITDPWLALPIEGVLQGPSFALLYSTIVAYASSVTPPGTSGTIQGLVAGMDDGLGISVGSLIGGFIYTYYGGRALYTSYSVVALLCALIHFSVFMIFFRNQSDAVPDSSKTYRLAKSDVEMTELQTKDKVIS